MTIAKPLSESVSSVLRPQQHSIGYTGDGFYRSKVGTCESFFFSYESDLESNRPSDSFSNQIYESNRPYTTQEVAQPNGLQAYRNPTVFCICDERE